MRDRHAAEDAHLNKLQAYYPFSFPDVSAAGYAEVDEYR